MKTAHTGRLHGLDTLRAFAVLMVMLYHLTIFGELPLRLLPVTYHGWMGVDLFFVLSGFLIGQQVLRPHVSGQRLQLGDFYARRAFRILPAYLVVLALYAFVPAWRDYPHMAPLWKYLTFTMNFGFTFSQRAFSHAWSLCVEEHFYLLLPVLVMLLTRRPSVRRTAAVLAAVVVGGIALRWWLVLRYPEEIWTKVYYPSYARLDGLTVGVALVVVRLFRPAWWQRMMRHGHALFFAGAVCVGSVVGMFRAMNLGDDTGSAKWGVIVGFPLLALGWGLILASSVSRNGVLSRVKVPGAQTLAALAFALYLTHKPVGHLVMVSFPAMTQPQGPGSWVLYAAACSGAAVVLYFGVERPFLKLRDRVL